MKISELISTVGDENISVQNLMQSSPTITKGKKEANIKFYTSNENASILMRAALGEIPKLTPILLWIPTDKIPK